MKKIFSLFLVISMLMPGTVLAAEADEKVLEASATFTKDGAVSNGATITTGVADSFDASEQKGKECWMLGVNEEQNCYIDLNITKQASNQYGNHLLEVTYLDEGTGHFSVKYSNYDNIQGKEEMIFLQNSGEWKTVSVPLMRTDLTNGITTTLDGKCAISLTSYRNWGRTTEEIDYSWVPVYISDVKLYALDSQDIVNFTINTDGLGRTYLDGDKQEITYVMKNIASATNDRIRNGVITYKVIDEDGEVIWTASDDIEVLREGKQKTITKPIDFKKYGVHTFRIEITDENAGVYSFAETEVSLSKKNTNQKEGFGVSAHFSWQDAYIPTMPLYINMGATLVRDECLWRDYEKTKGEYVMLDRWNDYIDGAIAGGVEPLVILGYENSLYIENRWPTTDEELEAFGNYVYHIVSDLKGRVKYFEVWNEPNLSGSNTEERADYAMRYARLLKVAATRAKEANEEAQIVGFVMAGWSPPFVDNMKKVDSEILEYINYPSFHEYTWGETPENSRYTNIVKWCTNSIKGYCGEDCEIWLTEMGFSEYEDRNNKLKEDNPNETIQTVRTTEKESAMYGVRSILWNDAAKLYKNIFFYTWINMSGSQAYREANFGLLNQDYSAKKGYVAYTAMSYFLGGAEFEKLDVDDENNYIYRYSIGENKNVQVAYNASDKPSEVTLNSDFGPYELYDMYGNKIASGDGASVKVNVDGAPVYLVSGVNGVSMNYKTNKATLVGEVEGAKAGEQAMVYVLNPGYETSDMFSEGALAYMEQITLSEGGAFAYSFPLNGGAGTYKIYIGYKDAELSEPISLEVKRDISGTAALYSGDTKIESLEALKNADGDIVVKGIIDNKYNSGAYANLYAAGYNDGKLLWIESTRKKSEVSDEDITSFNLKTKSFDNADEVKVFLWTDEMAPIGADIID